MVANDTSKSRRPMEKKRVEKKDPNFQHTSIYVPKPMLRELKLVAIESEVVRNSVNTVIVKALEQFLESRRNTVASVDTKSKQAYDSQVSASTEIPKEFITWISKLIYIFETQNETATMAIQQLLIAMTSLLKKGGHNGTPSYDPLMEEQRIALDDADRAITEHEKRLKNTERRFKPHTAPRKSVRKTA